tara:strand:+ start:2612 stop:2998 length:387 start_codon:yes stop_codon:yes gene_type:complete
MKLRHYLNLLFLFVISPAFAQESGAEINFETSTIDYGIISNGSDGQRIFSFSNSGKTDLIIQNVQSSCGCTVPKKPDGPIAPGKSSEIIVRYDTNRVGPFRKTITITTNVLKNPIIALKIKGTVLPKE